MPLLMPTLATPAPPPAGRREGRVLFVVSFLDLLAVSLIIPSLPQYVKAMDGGALLFGAIMSMYGFIQFFAAPVVGSLSDVYGRRRVLLACFLGAAAGYLLLGLSWNIYVVILSRIPSALFKHTLDVIKVAITDSADPASRAAAIGRLNAAANTGFIIGPAVGGYVSAMPNGFNYTALLTTAIFLFNYALVSLYFVDHMPTDALDKRHRGLPAAAHAPIDWKAMLVHSKDKLLGFREIVNESGAAQTLLLARLLLSMAALLYRSHFSILLEDKFGTDAQQRGYLLSYMGLLGALASSAVGLITRVLRSERLVLQVAAVVYVLTFFALSSATSIVAVYVILMPQVVSISLLRATSMALQTTFVSQEHVGAFMGISSSLTSISRTISPMLSGWTYLISIDGPAYGAAMLASVSAGLFCFSPHFAGVGRQLAPLDVNPKKALD